MAVKIRLARLGCRNRPFYRVLAADSTCRRDGKHLEVLGYYDPLTELRPDGAMSDSRSGIGGLISNSTGQDGGKRMGLNFDRVKFYRRRSGGVDIWVRLSKWKTVERYWLSVGAQPSEPVQRILFRAGALPPQPMLAMEHKNGPHEIRPIDPLNGKFLVPKKRADKDEMLNI
ncbi:hypothetical protein IFM89_031514 [Coptis chinensis]|uniref:Ribosomal protein S16 n=1 Tax=Coptis chinensis TaxID=261450 RepID=A0A835IET9_9MAGN|nr:hypothetical protein IFM89_031514 [Coptis chinensis]